MILLIYFTALSILILIFTLCDYNTNNTQNKKETLIKIFSLCNKVKTKELNIGKYKYGYDLWKNYYRRNFSEICYILKAMGLTKRIDRYFFNSIYGKYNIVYHNNYETFPDKSYERFSPNYYDKNEILFGTYDIQHFMYSYQHPFTCKNKKFILIKGWNAGHISEIHVISSYLKVAFDSNRIAIFDKRYSSIVANGIYCNNNVRNWECYLEPLSNCSLTDEDIKSSVRYLDANQNDRVVELDITQKYLNSIPQFVFNFLNFHQFSKKFLLDYWTIQSVTFVFRINKRTYNYLLHNNLQINRFIKKEYINVWIRHGDKYREMKLIPTPLYYSSIEFFFKLWGKCKVYVSSDDPDAINNVTKRYDSLYLKYERKNVPTLNNGLNKGDKLTLNVIADILIALSSIGFSGTLRSNIARIINELRMTVGYRLNSPFFEVGDLRNSQIFVYNV